MNAMEVLPVTSFTEMFHGEERMPLAGLHQSKDAEKEDQGEFEVELGIRDVLNECPIGYCGEDVESGAEVDEHTDVGELIRVGLLVQLVVESASVEAELPNGSTHILMIML